MSDYDTAELGGLVESRKRPIPFFLYRLFNSIIEFDSEEIKFDEVITDRRMAPFVAPEVEGKVMASRGSTTKTFKPAYVKPIHVIRPNKTLKRLPGEALTGEMSPEDRRDLLLMQQFVEHSEMIDNRLEWMAVQIVRKGAITVEGEDYPKQVVDFQRDATLSVTLLTTYVWGGNDADVIGDIESMSISMSKAANGAPASTITMDPDAWAKFRVDAAVEKLLDLTKANGDSNINTGPLANGDEVTYVGRLAGRFDIYVDSRSFVNDAGTTVPYLESGEVTFDSPAVAGAQCFGAIMDDDVLHAMRAYHSDWKENNPSVRKAMTQSAPLPVPGRINGTGYLKVL